MRVVMSLLFALPATAAAGTCDYLVLDAGDNDAIVGEWLQPVTLPIGWPPLTAWIPTGQTAVCWTDDVGVEHLELISACTDTSPSTDAFWIEGGAGDDWIAPLLRDHVGENFELTCGFRPERDGKLGPWLPTFDYDLFLVGGSGSDVLVGSPNDDVLISNDVSGAADSSGDLMCGGDGDDLMIGDFDDSTFGIEEFAAGGAGFDEFWGDFSTGGSPWFDVAAPDIEVPPTEATVIASGMWAPGPMCDGVDDPVNDWDATREWRTF